MYIYIYIYTLLTYTGKGRTVSSHSVNLQTFKSRVSNLMSRHINHVSTHSISITYLRKFMQARIQSPRVYKIISNIIVYIGIPWNCMYLYVGFEISI